MSKKQRAAIKLAALDRAIASSGAIQGGVLMQGIETSQLIARAQAFERFIRGK